MSAHDTINGVKQAEAWVTNLRKILKEMDPASGVSVSIRRGVARDNPEVEDDATKRPWVTVEMSDIVRAKEVIDATLRAAEQSLAFRISMAQSEFNVLGNFLANYRINQ